MRCWCSGWIVRQVGWLDAGGEQLLQVFGDVHDRRAGTRALADHLEILGWELVHHHPADLAVGDLGDQRRHAAASELEAGQASGLGVRLHLADELGVAALGLDHGHDLGGVAGGVGADQAVGQVRALQRPAVGQLDGVLLNQQPPVATVVEGLDERVGHVGVVGQRHLRGREAAHPAERLQAEARREVVLPGAHVQPVVLHRGGGGDGVAPGAAEPLNGLPHARVAGERSQGVDHIVETSASQPCSSVPEYSSMIRGWPPSASSWGMSSPIRL
jgi:hypothetical protein